MFKKKKNRQTQKKKASRFNRGLNKAFFMGDCKQRAKGLVLFLSFQIIQHLEDKKKKKSHLKCFLTL